MVSVLIILGLVVAYFVIAIIKESESREAVEIENQINKLKSLTAHYNDIVVNEKAMFNDLETSKKVFEQQSEANEVNHDFSSEMY